MTIIAFHRFYMQQLQSIYTPAEAGIITDWVFEKITGAKKAEIIKNPKQTPETQSEKKLQEALHSLLSFKPVQYVLGEAWFYGMMFKVNEQVLIPRPETEELVAQLLLDLKTEHTPLAILDIGTGSGCIPIAIKKNLPQAEVSGMDISKNALIIAEENAKLNNTLINFFQQDFLDEKGWPHLPNYNVIISNPPYIPLQQKDNLDRHVKDFEPGLALFVPDESPLIFYEKIARFANKNLLPGGKIYLEIHQAFADETKALFTRGFYSAEVKKDVNDNERMLIVTV